MQCAEDYVRYCCRHLLDTCRPDLDFIVSMVDKGAIERLEQVGAGRATGRQGGVLAGLVSGMVDTGAVGRLEQGCAGGQQQVAGGGGRCGAS